MLKELSNCIIVIWSLYFGLQPCLEFFERSGSVGDFVLLNFVHLSVSVGVRAAFQGSGWRQFGRGRGRRGGRTSCLRTRILDPILLRVSRWRGGDLGRAFLPKFIGPLAGTILPWTLSARCELRREKRAYICTALEYNWLMTRAFTIRKCTYSLSGLVFKTSKHIIEPLEAKSMEKPLAVEQYSQIKSHVLRQL